MPDRTVNGPARVEGAGEEPALGELIRQLAQDSATLVRQEVALAKAEMRQNLKAAARDATMVATGGLLALVGAMVLILFLVLLVGDALDEYWLGALIVGLVFLAVGGFLAKKSLDSLKRDSLAPEQTIQTLKEDKQWVQSEIQQARRA
ncbi:MAG TPA: phage holin family protein [Longimicrobiaceae bacterium]|nr:phage holin family protein [Longimicrobiaceae bacterium]